MNNFAKNMLLMGVLALPGCGDGPERCLVITNESNPVITKTVQETMDFCQANRSEILTCITDMERYEHAHEPMEIECDDSNLGEHVGGAFDSSPTFCVVGGAKLACDEE